TDGKLNTLEGSASISDSLGKLLFYTDGITVWDKTHKIMSNGIGLWGDMDATQSALIVKQPGRNIYYIFTVDAQAGALGGYGGITYSIVDMKMNGGLGGVSSKNNTLLTPTAEKVSGVVHRNGNDVWIIT